MRIPLRVVSTALLALAVAGCAGAPTSVRDLLKQAERTSDPAARAAVERFTASVHAFDAEIASRNAARQQPLLTFAPRCMELSVSL